MALDALLSQFKEEIRKMNVKENWAILRYVGDTTPGCFGLSQGKCYYWPCFKENLEYECVIDDKEFTPYLYSARPESWEVVEDPLGITLILNDS